MSRTLACLVLASSWLCHDLLLPAHTFCLLIYLHCNIELVYSTYLGSHIRTHSLAYYPRLCEGMCLAPINAFHCATDKTKALHGFWEIVFSLGSLDKFKEGKEYGLEEGKKSGLEEEGDFNRMFNQGARQGKADERNRWVEAGHCEQDRDTVRATSDNKNKQKARGKTSDIYVMDEYVHT